MEIAKIESLLAQLVALRDSWKAIRNEAKLVASSLQVVEIKLFRNRNSTVRKRTRFQYEETPDESVNEINQADESTENALFRKHIFYIVLDNVTGELTIRFRAGKQISNIFSFFGIYQKMSKEELNRKVAKLAKKYYKDISNKKDVVQEMNHIIMVYNADFCRKQLGALKLLNALTEYRLKSLFSNLSVSLRMFHAATATVASAERCFSKLKLIKN